MSGAGGNDGAVCEVARRPVVLTFPSWGIGATRIIADGKQEVGRVLGEFTGWRAYLWPEADPMPGQLDWRDMEDLWRLKLGEIRDVLRDRVADPGRGPWWIQIDNTIAKQ